VFLEFVYEADVSIRDNRYRGAMKAVDLLDEDAGHVFGIVCHMVGDVMAHLR
jgi:hypothetical protein